MVDCGADAIIFGISDSWSDRVGASVPVASGDKGALSFLVDKGDLPERALLNVSPKLSMPTVGGNCRPTVAGMVGSTGLLSNHVDPGFSGGKDIP